MTRILIAGGGTGGHLMPALGIAQALRAVDARVEPVLVGATRGVEPGILPARPFRYHLIAVEPIYRRTWWKNLRWPLVWWRVRGECRAILRTEQPALVVGTGGYAAGPLVWLATRRGIPVALQEQNAYPGIATRWLARRARQIHLGFPEARVHLRPGAHTEVHTFGNPITPPPDPRPDRATARRAWGLDPAAPLVLVVGGSQGARAINRAVALGVERDLWPAVSLVWSTGPATFAEFRRFEAAGRRVVRAFLDPIADAYAAADLVVARAGAMTTAELCAWGLPAVFVPLPTAAADHQTRNAAALAQAGAAVLLPEAGLTGEGLAQRVRALVGSPNRLAEMGRAAAARGAPEAALKIARKLLALVS